MKSAKKYLALVLSLALVWALGAPALAAEAAFEPIVLVDEDFGTVTVTGYDPDGDWGPAFELLLENKSDENLTFSLDYVAVSGVMCDPIWIEDVPAGKSAYSTMEWYAEDLAAVGVNYIDQVLGVLSVYDADTFDDLFVGTVSWNAPVDDGAGPAAQEVQYDTDFAPVELMAADGLTAVAKDFDPAGGMDGGPAFSLYLKNDTDEPVYFTMEDVTVNGFTCDPYWGADVAPGAVCYSQCEWWMSDLESSHIETMETMECTLEVWDADYDTIASAPVSLSVTGAGPAAETPAEEPAEEPAENTPEMLIEGPTGTGSETAAVLGAVEDGTYVNDFFGLTCTPGDGWVLAGEDELLQLQEAGSDVTDYASYMLQQLQSGAACYVLSAQGDDGLLDIKMTVQDVGAVGKHLTEEEILTMGMAALGLSEDGDLSDMGLEGATLEQNTVSFAGQDRPGLRLHFADSSLGVDLEFFVQMVFIMEDTCMAQVTMSSAFDEAALADMAGFFTVEG